MITFINARAFVQKGSHSKIMYASLPNLITMNIKRYRRRTGVTWKIIRARLIFLVSHDSYIPSAVNFIFRTNNITKSHNSEQLIIIHAYTRYFKIASNYIIPYQSFCFEKKSFFNFTLFFFSV